MKNSIWLVSPPASGKTTLLLDLFAQLPGEQWIFLSPLRALAEEFYLRAKNIIPTQMYQKNRNEIVLQRGLVIITPEQVDDRLLRQLDNSFLITDEIHLWLHWGDSFRPQMWEGYFGLIEKSFVVFHLTATVNDGLKKWIRQINFNFEKTYLFNYGNNQIKYSPNKIIFYPSILISPSETIKRKLLASHEGVYLIFCAYREEVYQWQNWCRENNIFSLSCVGGGAKAFQQELSLISKPPEVIISTTVLSHGVNLPKITGVYFTYKVSDQDFWLQMVTRGGRAGQNYEILTFDGQYLKPTRRLIGFIAMLREEFLTKLYTFFNCEGPWSLKESLPEKFPTKNAT